MAIGYEEETMMKNSIRLLIAVALTHGAIAAQRAKQPSFSVTIGTAQEAVKPGSTVMVQILYKNTSDHAITLPRSPSPEQGEFLNVIEMRDQMNKRAAETDYGKCLRESGGEGDMTVVVFTLQPGETLKDGVLLNKMYDLSRPGKYTIQVLKTDPDNRTTAKSNKLTITVKPGD
jgi:hypothetical protein